VLLLVEQEEVTAKELAKERGPELKLWAVQSECSAQRPSRRCVRFVHECFSEQLSSRMMIR
jgi:hypothetical protein